MTKQQAISYYRRADELERRLTAKLRNDVLVPYFGGCCCRLHNCKLNYESGHNEGPNHARDYKMAKYYDYKQEQIYKYTQKIKDHFAKFF